MTANDIKNPKPLEEKIENVYSKTSSKKGVAGFLEMLLRRFRIVSFILALIPVYFLAIFAMGLSATPGIFVFTYLFNVSESWPQFFHFLAIGFGIFAAYFTYGISLIFVIPFFNWILPFKPKPFRGSYFSIQSVPWYIHNAFTYIVRYTFLEFVTPTPLNILFYKMMGMKIGKGTQINTTNISDPALITIGDYVTIGGSAHIFAHYGQKGYLVLSEVKIENGVNVGIKATIMGDTRIGAGAMIGPHEVILPKSRIEAKRKPGTNNAQEKEEQRTAG